MDRMRSRPSRWDIRPYDVGVAERLTGELGVSRELAAVLVRRGLDSAQEARGFMAAEERGDPLELPGARAAAEAILAHVRRGSRIVVDGAYDVDGVCSPEMLVRTVRPVGPGPAWELPSRFGEGYGL